jgi:heme-degrading monooxygenase HmoA
MEIVLFKIQKRPDIDAQEFQLALERMLELVAQVPGFAGVEGYAGQDGSELVVARFESPEAIDEWREQPETRPHSRARSRGVLRGVRHHDRDRLARLQPVLGRCACPRRNLMPLLHPRPARADGSLPSVSRGRSHVCRPPGGRDHHGHPPQRAARRFHRGRSGLDGSFASDYFEGVRGVVTALSTRMVDPDGNAIGLLQPEGRGLC